MADALKLRILMDAVDKATAPLRRVRDAATALRAPLGDAADRLRTLEKTAGQVEKYRALHAEVRRNGDALTQAKAKAEALGQQLAATVNPTAKLKREFEAARQQVARATDVQQRSTGQLSQLRAQLAGAGVNSRTLAADQRKLTNDIAATTAAAERQAAQLRRRAAVRQAVNDNGTRREEMGGKLADAAAGAVSLGAPIAAAIKFESVMADVKKVVNFETPQQFKQMSDDVLLMSTRIPMAADGIGAIVAAAGQAGIARGELLRFAEDAAKMGVAFDLTGEQAGSAMTGLRTQFALSQDGVVQLGDAINHLSNNMDATAANLLDVANRSAGNARMFGLSGQQLSALGATFLALKSPPEVAATAINSMLGSLQTAPQQSKDFQKALQDVGLSAEYMKNAVKKDGQAALLTFLEAVKKSKDPMAVLTDMFGSEFSDDVSKLVLGLDKYKESLGLVADQTAYAGSMQAEYTARSETTANNLTLLANRSNRLGVSLGSILLPPLNTVASGLGMLADLAAAAAARAPVLTQVLVGTVAALIALRVATIGVGYAATFTRGGWLQLRGAYVAVSSGAALARVQMAATAVTTQASALATRAHAMASRQDAIATTAASNASRARGWAAMEEAAAQIQAAAAAQANRRASLLTATGWKQLGSVTMQAAARGISMATTAMRALTVATLTNPITWVAVGIAGAALLIYKYWQPLKAFFGGVWDGLKEGLAPLQSAFNPIMEAAAQFKAAFGDVAGPLGQAWASVKEALAPIGAALRPLMDSFGGLFDQVQMGADELNGLKDTGVSFGRALAAGVRFALLPMRGLLLLVGTMAKALIWTASNVASGVAAIWSFAGPAIMAPVRLAIAGTGLLIKGWTWVWQQTASVVKGMANGWLSIIGGVVRGIDALLQWSPTGTIAAAWDGVAAYFDGLWNSIVGRAEAAWNKLSGLVSTVRSIWPFGDGPASALPTPATGFSGQQREELAKAIAALTPPAANSNSALPASPMGKAAPPQAQPPASPLLRLVTPAPTPAPSPMGNAAPAPAVTPSAPSPALAPAPSPVRVVPVAQVPRAKAAGPTITNSNSYQISVTAAPGMSEQQLAREIRRQLEERDRAQASGARSAQYDRLSVGR